MIIYLSALKPIGVKAHACLESDSADRTLDTADSAGGEVVHTRSKSNSEAVVSSLGV